MNTDKILDDARGKIALLLAKDAGFSDSRGWNYLPQSAQQVCGEQADQILALSGTTDIECPKCEGKKQHLAKWGTQASWYRCPGCNGTGVIKEPWEMGVHLKNGELPDKISHAGHGVTTLELCEFIQQDMLDAGYVQKVGD